ncbi:DUF177 domain-containing protein [Nicoliella spurrieriana]|uniref:DUF177 domain-containing protein n=1 Tax=Nicoliella spurrieriana TaxID=2925830 RepID=A0A976RS03_9LACO|nr:DUF177 domain-containing protein [Nicoliella spurrieriana]UQS86696.1 DUF177 domain-containing protein [Nicoliella spurrieriana]
MKWYLSDLKDYKAVPLSEQAELDLKDDLLSRYADQILDVHPVTVQSHVFYDQGNAIVNAQVKGEITVPSSRSLTPVKFPLDFSINEVYVPDEAALRRFEQDDGNAGEIALVTDEEGAIDFDKAVADNIILQIPMHILSPEESEFNIMPTGEDWQVVSEDDFNHPKAADKPVDPRLTKLKDFFNQD